ncbi:hypothetical protein [Streptomyces hainanensis]|uniref:Translation elongation factor EFG/EF2 domain-containing protein n=1 Tax=Streptomyces hainanensis TaxID=402648 RepID=A0A4R4TJW4_9ACTN|nr:hypothetical protein [Streptomyces hainanensis]TDC78151.1 hypothetical protein E1283_05610 [Streptomyces hainanensis]
MTPLPVPVRDVRVRVRMNACCGPFALVVADFEPPGADGALEVVSAVSERRLPAEFLPALREGLLEGLGEVTAAVLITDGAFHEVDSSELGYRIAGREGGRAALVGAGLLPPREADALRWATWPGRPRPGRKRNRP